MRLYLLYAHLYDQQKSSEIMEIGVFTNRIKANNQRQQLKMDYASCKYGRLSFYVDPIKLNPKQDDVSTLMSAWVSES